MAKKTSKKSLKSLFSRSEASLAAHAEKDADKTGGEKKSFKFPKFGKKSKSDSEKPESPQVLSDLESSNTAENREAWPDDGATKSKKFSLYGTSPRSKGKEFSYSELDLRKPKRFSTFSFGLRKRKMKDAEGISKSTFGLHHQDIEEEAPLDLRQMELDQAKTKTMFSMSQPELDSSSTFDIPSPPPVAANHSDPFLSLFSKSQSTISINTQSDAKDPQKKGSDVFDAPMEMKAPIASIPELQPGNPSFSQEKEDIPVHVNLSKSDSNSAAAITRTETASDAGYHTLPMLPASLAQILFDNSYHNAAVVESVSSNDSQCDNDCLEQSHTLEETPVAASPVTSSHYDQPDAPDTADSTATNVEPSLASADSNIDTTITESTPAFHSDFTVKTDPAPQEISMSHTEGTIHENAKRITTASAVHREKSLRTVDENAVYGALCESLLPQSFTSEAMSSLSNPPPQIRTEIRHLNTKLEPVMVKTLNDDHAGTNIVYSLSTTRYSAAGRMDDSVDGRANRNDILSDRKVISLLDNSRFTPPQTTVAASEPPRDVHHRYIPPTVYSGYEPGGSSKFSYSELTQSLTEGKSGSSSLIPDTVRSFPAAQISAPPICNYATSQGTATRVTDSIRKVILVKEIVTDEVRSDTGRPSPVPETITPAKRLGVKMETTDHLRQVDRLEGHQSPTYLSVGSDDGSMLEIYYSAEEDNGETEDEERYTVDKREEIGTIHRVSEVIGLRQEIPHPGEIAEGDKTTRRDRELKGVVVKILNEDGNMGRVEKKDGNSGAEVQQQQKGHSLEAEVQESQTFLAASDAKTQQKEEVAAAVFSHVKEEGREERKEELLATPVQQVNTPMVCEVAPPSSERYGERDSSGRNWPKKTESDDPSTGEKQLLSHETEYVTYKDDRSYEYIHAATRNTSEKHLITPISKDAAEQGTLTGKSEQKGEVSKDGTLSSGKLTTSAATDASGGVEVVSSILTRLSELRSDATDAEHDRARQNTEWVDTVAAKKVPQQVAVELSTPNTARPATEAADALSARQEHLTGARLPLSQGSWLPSAASRVFGRENRLSKAEWESAGKMESVYSSLSTTRSTKNSTLPQKNESKYGFGKVSADSMRSPSESALNEADSGSKYKWKNRFEGVSQYRPYGTEESSLSDSLSYGMSDSSSSIPSAPPENTAHKYYDNASSSPHPFPVEHAFANVLNDKLKVYLRYEGEPAEEKRDDWRRGLAEQEEPAAPADERERGRESEGLKSHWDSQRLPLLAQQTSSGSTVHFQEGGDHESEFSGVFKATRVDLIPDSAAPPSSPPSSPDTDSPNQLDMEILVDTLKSMGPSLRPRNTSIRAPAPVLVSGLPPIVEDSGSPVVSDVPGSPVVSDVPDSVDMTTKETEATDNTAVSPNGFYVLPSELGLKRGHFRDGRSPLEMIRQNHQEQPGTRELNSPLRTSVTSTLLMRKASDSSPEDVQVLNGNGGAPPSPSSRLENSIVFRRTSSIEQMLEQRQAHRSLFHTSSLPESGLLKDRTSVAPKELELGSANPGVSRFDRFSYLLNSISTSHGSFTLADDHNPHMSRLPALSISSPPLSNSPTRLLSPTGSIDLQRSFTTDSSLSMFSQPHGMGAGTGRVGAPILQRSFSDDATGVVQQNSPFKIEHGGPRFQPQELERNLAPKYRAFPDAYLTKEKEHGKLNPRPGKIYIFDRPGMRGQRIEVRSDVTNAMSWELQETISIRVVRGGWVLYEKPEFKGEKIALDEGDLELTYPFSPPEEEQQQNGDEESKEQSEGTGDGQTESKPARRFIIGSLRRVVRDYSVPEISLFPEQNAEGKKVIFRDTSDDARIFGFPIKAHSIIVNAGLWLVYAHPFFQGAPRVLEVGGYTNPEAWGVEQPLVGSLHPLKIGEPKVENMTEPQIVIYHKPYFSGKSRIVTTNARDFMTRTDQEQGACMFSAGSLKVLGGIWVGYEKEGFRGHQYLLEEGDYHDWRVWGGLDSELRSVRMIRADLTDPLMVMFEQQEEEQQNMEENSFEVTEAIPDVELFDYKTSTSSIEVVSGAWIAYSHVDFSGSQYILEKGFYNNSADWGSQDNRICSVQPILLAPSAGSSTKNQVIIYSEPDFKGECQVIDCSQEAITAKGMTKSCKVSRGSWVFYEDTQFSGKSYVLSEGDYPNLASMGCPPCISLRSIKAVPMMFCIPSISLFGLECLEGREITTDTEILSMVEEGFNNHILSLRVNRGCWVICEHSNYRGRQFLLEPIEITNWVKFSSLQTIGSMYPVRQKRRYFRIKNKESGHFLSIQGGVEPMKSGRVVVSQEVEPMSDIWFYQDGFIKNKLSSNMSLQMMGNLESGAKVVLWAETRQPIQTWTAQMRGLITSHTFRGMVLDVKGGKTYDKDHVVIMPEDDERPSQQWEIELL